jgi:pyrroloquinoline quinone biosynthesis protein E
MSALVSTIDFHVTSECSQDCPYCWGPQDIEHPVDTATARLIIDKIRAVGARRIVFTGGDPLKRSDIAELIHHAHDTGLEVALSTTGDEVTAAFLADIADAVDLISLPIDGASEAVSARTKKEGHLAAVLATLEMLRAYPRIDVKAATPVTRHNLADVPNIAHLVEEYAKTTRARVFYNIFHAYPRAQFEAEWDELLITGEDFAALRDRLAEITAIRINLLSHETLDRLYVMVFPDGQMVVPSGGDYCFFGPFLDVEDLDATLAASDFASARHWKHSKGWEKGG